MSLSDEETVERFGKDDPLIHLQLNQEWSGCFHTWESNGAIRICFLNGQKLFPKRESG